MIDSLQPLNPENVQLIGKIAQNESASKSTDSSEVDSRLMDACKNFEAIFVSHLLKTMRSSLDEGGMFGKGFGGSHFQDLMEMEVGKKISHGDGIGLAGSLYKHLNHLKGKQLNQTNSINEPVLSKPIVPVRDTKISAYKETSPSVSNYKQIRPYHRSIMKASRVHNIEPSLLYAVIDKESSGNPKAKSSQGAKGLMQLMDATAKEMGVNNSFDPEDNILGGSAYLRKMLDQFDGDVELSLAAYNAGPGTVRRYGGIPPYKETRNYVNTVVSRYNQYKKILS